MESGHGEAAVTLIEAGADRERVCVLPLSCYLAQLTHDDSRLFSLNPLDD